MNVCWPLLLFCLIRPSESNNLSALNIAPFVLNGYYVKWPSRKVELRYAKNKRYIAKNIIYTRFQLCAENVYLVSPRYRYVSPTHTHTHDTTM